MSNQSSSITVIAKITGIVVSVAGIPAEAAAASTVILSVGGALAIGLIGYSLMNLITSDNDK